jgi:hypothetical protein
MRRRRVQQVRKKGKQDYAYGLTPVDYSKPPSIAPTLIPPPQKRGLQRLLAPATMLAFLGFGVYLYFNSDAETYDYWKRVETGAILIQDDDEEIDDEENEEEE